MGRTDAVEYQAYRNGRTGEKKFKRRELNQQNERRRGAVVGFRNSGGVRRLRRSEERGKRRVDNAPFVRPPLIVPLYIPFHSLLPSSAARVRRR